MNAYVCGCVRNNAPYLLPVFANIAQLVPRVFREIHIIMAVDPSEDGSLDILLKLQTQFPKMDILMRDADEPRSHVRVENIARARNALLEHLRRVHLGLSLAESDQWSYFIMMDMDDVCSKQIHPEVLTDALQPSVAAKWDALSWASNDYYDIWALSWGPFVHSCWHWDNPHPLISETRGCLMQELNACEPSALVPCFSAFNGFAIYRIGVFLDGCYLPRLSPHLLEFSLPDRSPRHFHWEHEYVLEFDNLAGAILGDCEHRHFHLEAVVRKGARIRISPRRLFASA